MGKHKNRDKGHNVAGVVQRPGVGRREIFARVRKSVVAIVDAADFVAGKPYDFTKVRILGTGFLVEGGLVVTAGHVIDPWLVAAQTTATTSPSGQPALSLPNMPKVLFPAAAPIERAPGQFQMQFHMVPVTGAARAEKGIDLAALRLASDDHSKTSMKSRDHLAIATQPCAEGDHIAACGYPFGRDLHAVVMGGVPVVVPTFTQGIVSAILPHVGAPVASLQRFQMQMPIAGGNSGGPIFDPYTGDVVGVVTDAIHNTVKRVKHQPETTQPTGAGAQSAEILINIDMPTGLALGEHAHRIHNFVIAAQKEL